MAYTFDTNNTPATGSEAVYLLKEALKTAGWTVASSSDGTTYNASGDQISSGSSGAGGMANSSAWFRIQMPTLDSVVREFTFQRSTSLNYQWRIKYSYSAGFTGGSPGATQTPSATDEQILAGAGTDASPTYSTILNSSDGGYRWNIAAGGAAENYVFYAFSFASGGGVVNAFWLLDRMLSGSYPSADVDPVVMGFAATALNVATIQSTSSVIKAYLDKGGGSEGFVSMPGCVPEDSATHLAGNLGTNPHTGNDDSIPIIFARRSALGSPAGWKGIGSMLRMNGVTRTTGDTYSVGSARDRIIVDDCNLPWDASVPTV